MGELPESVTKRHDRTYIVSASEGGFLLKMARRLSHKAELFSDLGQVVAAMRKADG